MKKQQCRLRKICARPNGHKGDCMTLHGLELRWAAKRKKNMTKRRKPKLKSKAERTLREILGDPKLAVSAGLLLGMALAVTHGLIDPSKPALPGDCSGCIGPYGIPCPPDCPNFGNHFDGCHKRDCLKQCEGSKK